MLRKNHEKIGIFQNPSKFIENIIVIPSVPNSKFLVILETSEPPPDVKKSTFSGIRCKVSVGGSSNMEENKQCVALILRLGDQIRTMDFPRFAGSGSQFLEKSQN